MPLTEIKVLGINELRIKLAMLEEKERKLKRDLKHGYNYELYMQLNVVRHKIQVVESRIDGTFCHSINTVTLKL